MKVLVVGVNGFIGGTVESVLAPHHDVYGGERLKNGKARRFNIDLLDKETIRIALKKLQPEVVINCAGIVENSEKAMLNPVMTSNLLEEIVASELTLLKRVIILGSAAEYGIVQESDIPVDEEVPLNATSNYGLSKIKETSLALDYQKKYSLPLVVARIFNPIGTRMPKRLLIPNILEQLREVRDGKKLGVEISRLDAKRDYIGVTDVALAIGALIEDNLQELIYNIGSGQSTSNGELFEMILDNFKMSTKPKVVETSDISEPLFACQADIARINKETGWSPSTKLSDNIKEIVNEA